MSSTTVLSSSNSTPHMIRTTNHVQVRFFDPSGSSSQESETSSVLQKYTKLFLYGWVDIWYADVPAVVWRKWHDRNNKNNCVAFSIVRKEVDADAATTTTSEQLLGKYESCHNAGALPDVFSNGQQSAARPRPAHPPAEMKTGGRSSGAPATKYNFTLCYATLLTPDTKNKGLRAGYRHLLPAIAYHVRHGVDQIILFVDRQNRDFVAKLVGRHWTAQGLVGDVPWRRPVGEGFDVSWDGHVSQRECGGVAAFAVCPSVVTPSGCCCIVRGG